MVRNQSLKNRSHNTLYTTGCLGQGQFAFITWGAGSELICVSHLLVLTFISLLGQVALISSSQYR